MELLYLQASEVLAGQHAGLFDRIYRKELLGCVVRGVFSVPVLAQAVRTLSDNPSLLPSPPMEHFKGRQFGRTLVVAGEKLDPYFADAQAFRSSAVPLFGEAPTFEEQLTNVLRRLVPSVMVAPPVGPTKIPYGLSTLRILEPNGTILVHCENETLRFPAMHHLQTLLDLTTQVSFYTPLQLPEAGGELRVYDACFGTPSAEALQRQERLAKETIAALEARPYVTPHTEVGDLLLFDAGRFYHRVTPVVGPRSRWTMGGFIAYSADKTLLHYWA